MLSEGAEWKHSEVRNGNVGDMLQSVEYAECRICAECGMQDMCGMRNARHVQEMRSSAEHGGGKLEGS